MNSKHWATRGIVGATAVASAALLTCGNAAANPVDELVVNIGKAIARSDMRVPAATAIEDSRAILTPARNAATGNRFQFVNIKNAACKANSLGITSHAGLKALYPGYSDWEINAVEEQVRRYANTTTTVVAIICTMS